MVNDNIEENPKKKSRLFGRKGADASAPATPQAEVAPAEAAAGSAETDDSPKKAPARKRTSPPKSAANHENAADSATSISLVCS